MLRLSDSGLTVLFAGDGEAHAEAACLDRGFDLKADILKVGHHGSRTSSTPEFLDAVRPELAVISCGVMNRFDHPAATTLDALSGRGVSVHRTDRDGSIMVGGSGGNLLIRRFPPVRAFPPAGNVVPDEGL